MSQVFCLLCRLKQLLTVGNYTAFFEYCGRQDRFISSLLELYLDKMMIKFLLMVCKTCGEKVPITSLCKLVGSDPSKLESIIRAENGIIQNGQLMLKSSY